MSVTTAGTADRNDGRPLRVLQVSAFFPLHGGGIEVVAGHLANGLADAGVEVHWMAGGSPSEVPVQPGDASHGAHLQLTHAASFDPLERRLGLPAPLWSPAAVVRLWHATGRADVVHVHDYLYMPTLLAALFARLRRRPLVVTQHIGEISYGSRIASRVLAILNQTLGAWVLRTAAQTAFVARPVMLHFSALTAFERPPMLVPNGVDHRLFAPERGPRPAPASEPVSLLFVGRFVEKKGLRLLRSCLDLKGASWTFVGWGPEPPLDQPREEVQVLGRLPPEDVAHRYRQADLLVLPSWGEGFPLVVQEALACGTPVLVSTEVAEAFPTLDSRCVFDVELRCADPAAALRIALQSLVADPRRLAAARAFASELAAQWSWSRCIDAYRSVYDRVRR